MRRSQAESKRRKSFPKPSFQFRAQTCAAPPGPVTRKPRRLPRPSRAGLGSLLSSPDPQQSSCHVLLRLFTPLSLSRAISNFRAELCSLSLYPQRLTQKHCPVTERWTESLGLMNVVTVWRLDRRFCYNVNVNVNPTHYYLKRKQSQRIALRTCV